MIRSKRRFLELLRGFERAKPQRDREFWKTRSAREYIDWGNAKSFVDRVFKDKKISGSIFDELKKKEE